jgi:hypothetical protein
LARDFAVEWSIGKPPDYFVELWNVEATVLAVIEATAHKNPDLAGLLAMLAKRSKGA